MVVEIVSSNFSIQWESSIIIGTHGIRFREVGIWHSKFYCARNCEPRNRDPTIPDKGERGGDVVRDLRTCISAFRV
jgi:hypothetical protein